MDKENWLLKAMNVRREEARPVLLLMLFSFFVGLSLTFYFTASNAIFLKHFPSKIISFSYVASGIVVYLAWLLLSRLDRRMSVPNQLLVKILFVFLSVLAISVTDISHIRKITTVCHSFTIPENFPSIRFSKAA